MKNVTVFPGSANGIVSAPPSLDEALSAIVLAAITKTRVRGFGSNSDTVAMFNGLFALGAKFRQQDETVKFYSSPQKCDGQIECTHKAFALLMPLCAALGGEYTFLGEFDSSIIRGPESLLIDWSVNEQGITLRSNGQTHDITLTDETFASGFVLALPLMGEAHVVYNGDTKSLKMIQAIMHKFGFGVSDQGGYSLTNQRETDTNYVYSVGGDYGKAAYYLLAGFLSGEVGVTGLLSDSVQTGRSIIDELKGMKLRVQEMNGAVFAKKSRMSGEIIDLRDTAEPLIALALACFCKGKCVIKNAHLLHAKRREEFDLTAVALKKIGADIVRIGMEYYITGSKKLFGGNVDAQGHQNAAMVLAAAALCTEIGVSISNAPLMDGLVGLGVSLQ